MPSQFRVLTFNTWLLRTPLGVDIAEDIEDRLRSMPDAIARTGADIVALQEVWDPKLRARLIESLREVGYSHFGFGSETDETNEVLAFSSLAASVAPAFTLHQKLGRREVLKKGALLATAIGLNAWGTSSLAVGSFQRHMGNGLLVASRFPVVGPVGSLRFSDHTRPDERLVLKGAIRITVAHPVLGEVDVYNTHLGAVSYRADEKAYDFEQARARLRQTSELVNWIAERGSGRLGVLACDLNVDYRRYLNGKYVDELSSEYALLTSSRGLGWLDAYGDRRGRSSPDDLTDSETNPYKPTGFFKSSPDCVIDYVLHSPDPRWRVIEARVVLNETTSGTRPKALSDHFGVLATFTVA